MLTQEKMNLFNQLITNNQAPAPEDSADFEVYKALINSQALAQNAASQTNTTTSTTATSLMAAPVSQPAPAFVETSSVTPSNGCYSMDDLMSNQMVVDEYLKVKYQQTFIGNNVVGMPNFLVSIDLDKVVAKLSIKGGSPVKYASTLDGKTCVAGGSWLDAVRDIQSRDRKARPYSCVDLSMTLLENVTDPSGKVICPAGTVIGHTTSTTNWRNWVDCYRNIPEELKAAGATVKIRISRKDIQKNGNSWGLVEFEYVPE